MFDSALVPTLFPAHRKRWKRVAFFPGSARIVWSKSCTYIDMNAAQKLLQIRAEKALHKKPVDRSDCFAPQQRAGNVSVDTPSHDEIVRLARTLWEACRRGDGGAIEGLERCAERGMKDPRYVDN
jgi:hypothetical protein